VSNLSVNAANLVLGPARLYVAAFGTTEPLDSTVTPNGTTTPPASPWADVGGTDGGVAFAVANTYTDLAVDQLIMAVGSRLTDMKMTVTTKMSEMTFGNLNTALNNIATTGSGSGYTTLDIPVGSAATQPTYAALCLDAWAPMLNTGAPALGRIIVRKVLSDVKVNQMYDRKTQASLDVTFNAFFVSNSIAPVHLVYQTA
jgi:hypothetical protein